ncbi:LysR family transcriptional regulator [Shewanella sp. UCD-KL21]|uniref:LysR family transcriptional regulator n=1 Tax=Shewanella sp. UCD-KL21 TaxID=1917164 RepID=UPI0009704C1E|nr:LysR family transcriptional regulator [Shewanella sp. UCD-KL21]
MDKLTAAKVFVDVTQSGSFTATADRLEMSRPMVTRYIEAMEQWLDIRLLHRTTRKVTLTSAGERCLKDVELWLEQADGLVAMSDTSEQLSGIVRVAASMSFGFSQLIPAIHHFMRIHPKVHIDIDLQDSVADLTQSQIDLAIRIAANPDPSLIGKPIAMCQSVLVASPEYVASNDKITEPNQLTKHSCLGNKNFQRHLWHLTNAKQQLSVDVDCKLTANETTALLYASICGAGVSVQPTYLANKYIENGTLLPVLPEWKPDDMTIYALYSSRKNLSANVRALIDFLQSYFKENPW